MGQKYFKANVDRIESTRISRGLSLEQVASKAVVSTRTLDSLMAGGRGAISTFAKIAKALEVPIESILEGYEDPEPPKERLWTVTITVSTPFKDFDETRDLPFFLSKLLLKLGGDGFSREEVKPGSTNISMGMNRDQVLLLVRRYLSGRLAYMEVTQIIVPARVPEGSKLLDLMESPDRTRIILGDEQVWRPLLPEIAKAINDALQSSEAETGD